MKSFKNHFSLVIALVSILFSIQIFVIVDRTMEAYKENLANNYSIIIISQKKLQDQEILDQSELISRVTELSADNVIERLNSGITEKNKELLKLTLPKFYKLNLTQYPSPSQIKNLRKKLLKIDSIKKIEDFSHNHDTTYKLLLLFKTVVFVFAIVVFVVTTLLIFKELRIWQFKHNERMSIMALFGAPIWLRSAVLFRLAIVDAIIAGIITFGLFIYISSSPLIKEQFENLSINIVVFDLINDTAVLFTASITLSIILALMIVIGHKEEV
ncbi:MAG: cell division protein FtsX [Sulfurimonas sp.]|uniref:cell division protein FtsX n=1 Tax=Sulfurimonas sp. TaxID=2022749 RepID=UPI0025EA8DE5|nr:cell division protein FtsX [Sulfurimonas sp.]MCK9490824.1 cell division protein FtsX [Sulfurimonas sp.]